MNTEQRVVVGMFAIAGAVYLIYKTQHKPIGGKLGNLIIQAQPPANETEGTSYNASVTVTNTSKKGTTPVPYTFDVGLVVAVNSVVIYSESKPLQLAAGASGQISWTFTIPMGTTGAGYAQASLYNTEHDTLLAQTPYANIAVEAMEVTPGGSISW